MRHPRESWVWLLNTSNWPSCHFLLVEMTYSICSSLKHTWCYTVRGVRLISHNPLWSYIIMMGDIHVRAPVATENSWFKQKCIDSVPGMHIGMAFFSRTCDIYTVYWQCLYSLTNRWNLYEFHSALTGGSIDFSREWKNALTSPADIQTCCYNS